MASAWQPCGAGGGYAPGRSSTNWGHPCAIGWRTLKRTCIARPRAANRATNLRCRTLDMAFLQAGSVPMRAGDAADFAPRPPLFDAVMTCDFTPAETSAYYQARVPM